MIVMAHSSPAAWSTFRGARTSPFELDQGEGSGSRLACIINRRSVMQAKDVMVSPAITVSPDASVPETANILLKNRISAVPVVDPTGAILGIVSEGDLMRRAEIGTERHRSWWLEMLASSNTIAMDYVKSHAQKGSDVMTAWPIAVGEETPLAEIANLLETRQIKRVPVVRDGKVIGIVSRADLLQAFASTPRPVPGIRLDAPPRARSQSRRARPSRRGSQDDGYRKAGAALYPQHHRQGWQRPPLGIGGNRGGEESALSRGRGHAGRRGRHRKPAR